MQRSLEFILGLLDRDFPARVAWEDFLGEHGAALRLWQRKGFLAREPGRHPTPSCPNCLEGVPHLLGGRYVCNACQSTVDPRHLLLWDFDLDMFLRWLARSLNLTDGFRPIAECLWQLGTLKDGEYRTECFFLRKGQLGERGRQRLLAFRNKLILRAVSRADPVEGFRDPCLALVEVIRQERGVLKATCLIQFLEKRALVRFEEASGAIFAGDFFLGEVTVGSKEYHLLAALSRQQDRYVAYADIKHEVLRATGSADTTEEATFCHKLKSRIKKRIPEIDSLIVTTNKGDGFRLGGHIRREL